MAPGWFLKHLIQHLAPVPHQARRRVLAFATGAYSTGALLGLCGAEVSFSQFACMPAFLMIWVYRPSSSWIIFENSAGVVP